MYHDLVSRAEDRDKLDAELGDVAARVRVDGARLDVAVAAGADIR
jgi:hypothetical protein